MRRARYDVGAMQRKGRGVRGGVKHEVVVDEGVTRGVGDVAGVACEGSCGGRQRVHEAWVEEEAADCKKDSGVRDAVGEGCGCERQEAGRAEEDAAQQAGADTGADTSAMQPLQDAVQFKTRARHARNEEEEGGLGDDKAEAAAGAKAAVANEAIQGLAAAATSGVEYGNGQQACKREQHARGRARDGNLAPFPREKFMPHCCEGWG